MKNSAEKKRLKTDDFQQFKSKIFIRTVLLAALSVVLIFVLYALVLQGHLAEFTIYVLKKVFRLKYSAAYSLYVRIFRLHADLWVLLAVVCLFFVIFRIYLNWFARYFREINRGIDTLLDGEAEEVSLSPELSVIEKKINTVRHTLARQKLAEQQKNDLVLYLAHDLKTPLASVIGYLNLLHDEGEITDQLREKYLSITLQKAQRLEDLINEFFEIAKFNLSNITLQYRRINLTRLLEMLLYEFQPMLREKELECKLDIAQDVMMECDADKLQRVFDNLLRNAVIYSDRGTQITVLAKVRGDEIFMQFRNFGAPIPQDKLGRIFEQFYRLDSARGTSEGGAGLGLAIAKQIVELHGGTITARSEQSATFFEITLPLKKNAQAKEV